jgi:hypothetical protein
MMSERKLAVAALALTLLVTAGVTRAELKLKGSGKTQELVREQFSGKDQAGFDLFNARCTKCHEIARPVSALVSGVTPISNSPFDNDGIKKYVVKMMRKPNSGISKDDAKAIIEFLTTARQKAVDK